MREAQGKYITLLDADDWLDKEGFPQVIEKVNKMMPTLVLDKVLNISQKREVSC